VTENPYLGFLFRCYSSANSPEVTEAIKVKIGKKIHRNGSKIERLCRGSMSFKQRVAGKVLPVEILVESLFGLLSTFEFRTRLLDISISRESP
jgi:hypothetical protein